MGSFIQAEGDFESNWLGYHLNSVRDYFGDTVMKKLYRKLTVQWECPDLENSPCKLGKMMIFRNAFGSQKFFGLLEFPIQQNEEKKWPLSMPQGFFRSCFFCGYPSSVISRIFWSGLTSWIRMYWARWTNGFRTGYMSIF